MSEIQLRCDKCGYATSTYSPNPEADLLQHPCRPIGTAPAKSRPASAKKTGLQDFVFAGCVLSVIVILFVSTVAAVISLAFFPFF